MEPVVHNSLSDLAPGVYVTSVTLSVDRVFIRESITQLGEPPRDVKVFEGVELICWDEEGTRILCSMVSHAAVAVHGNILAPKKTFITKFSIAEPGYGIHPRFHIRLDAQTEIQPFTVPFVDRVFDLRTPSDIPRVRAFVGNIYDFCGYVRHASPVVPFYRGGYVEMEFILVLESLKTSNHSGVKATAIIHLRGSWVEAECLQIRHMLHHNEHKPFILIKRLQLGRPQMGRPLLHSICNATKIVYDIAIQEVLEKRAELLCG